ncbi:hypothetical protein [Methylobacterium sp. ARG-1]|uniref:hypothetical protein n=1 Tax=Methylobacterium sp. ARG-1 TaxID=1692501 RepID=UPI000B3238FB|nr:hypothetical protein [Methylobacterium sp. ARG-1]
MIGSALTPSPLGWTDRELFGVHPEHGTLRVNYRGALMVVGKQATGVQADRVAFKRTTAYRDTPGKVRGPPA